MADAALAHKRRPAVRLVADEDGVSKVVILDDEGVALGAEKNGERSNEAADVLDDVGVQSLARPSRIPNPLG